MQSNLSGPEKQVCYREISTIFGERRFHCISMMICVCSGFKYMNVHT